MTTATYTVTMIDRDAAPAWERALCGDGRIGDGRLHMRTMEIDGRTQVMDLYTMTVATDQADALEAALDADDSVLEYAAQWQPPTDEQADSASSVGWSDAYDPALDDEIDPERIAAHEADGESWDAEIAAAVAATTEAEQTAALEHAGQIEREWGDDPATRRVREILGR